MTREELNKKQRELRRKNNNAYTKKYEKTKKGFIMRTFRNMKSRCEGIQYLKSHLYEGKELLNKHDFYDFTLNNNDFHSLFDSWELSGYNRKLTPSIDRIDSSKGYVLENMRWVTHSENSRNTSQRKKNVYSA